jgi:osmotically-inducible protein OsmY
MQFFRFTAAALLTCGLAVTGTFAAEEKADVKTRDQSITLQVRKAIAGDVSLSHAGNNIGITTTAGKVLLRGTVSSEFAKAEIERHAVIAAGEIANVTSELKVVGSK